VRRLLVALLVCSSACRSRELHIEPPDTNIRPSANAGTGGTFDLNTVITLDAGGSYDPDGTIVSYRWRVGSRAAGSRAEIADDNAEVTTFVLDEPGDYAFELAVTDDADATATSMVAFHATAPELFSVAAGVDQSVPLQTNVQLSGSVDADPDAVVTVSWTLLAKPQGSSASLSGATTLDPRFVADREGAYLVRMIASTPYQSMSDDVTVTAVVARQLLEYTLVDAEYSTALDRFIIVSDAPPRLRIHDAKTNMATVITLAEPPVAVSVAPNGLRAAVAHANKLSIVDLQTLAVTGPFTLTMTFYDIVLGADNRVHCFHRGYNSEPIRTLNLSNGTVSETVGWVNGETQARLHPSNMIAYGATTNISPGDIYRYDVASSPVVVVGDSPYHGQYEMGGGVWFTQDGASIITRSGNIFNSSSNPMLDMTYAGTLGLGDYNWVTHAPAAGKLAALRTEYDAWFNPSQFLLRIYNDTQFTLLRTIMLPDTPYNSMTYPSAGRFVAFSADSSKLYVIARAGGAPGIVHALYTFDP
jgi:hypothetical protein